MVFSDLVTGQEKEIKKRTVTGESAVLQPGDGQVKMRTVYVGRGEDRTQVRVKIPVERKAPSPHAVAGHLRRVRKAASPEAAERVREYGIAVPEGYTFVRPFRKGRIRNPYWSISLKEPWSAATVAKPRPCEASNLATLGFEQTMWLAAN